MNNYLLFYTFFFREATRKPTVAGIRRESSEAPSISRGDGGGVSRKQGASARALPPPPPASLLRRRRWWFPISPGLLKKKVDFKTYVEMRLMF